MKKTIVTLLAVLLFALSFGMNQVTNAVTNESLDHEAQFIFNEPCDRTNPNYYGNSSLTNGLDSNETTLFYMYSDTDGMYFLDPLAEFENVIFVGHDDYKVLEDLYIDTDNLHHGKRYVGAFADNELWELVGLIEVDIIELSEK